MVEQNFTQKTKQLIDKLKGICNNAGLGNSGDEFNIITQVFLYKFMNDKFGYEAKQIEPKLNGAENWEEAIRKFSDEEYELLLSKMSPDSARLRPDHFISTLWNKQNSEQFSALFSDTLRDIAKINNDVFSVKTEEGQKIQLFNGVDGYLRNQSEVKKDDFAKALIGQLVDVNFEEIFDQKFDFFSTIFEYLIKDYNKDGGGVYAEYYTPHAIAKIMAAILVDKPVSNVSVYDPSAGSGTLLMNVAHAIGEDKCTIYSQDISDKSSNLLRLNLILNNLVHSIHNVVQGNTIKDPYFKSGSDPMKFDFIVSNPPFKLDFSDWREDIDTKDNSERFFAGIPNIPKKKKDSMAIYLLFIQHIIHSLSTKGKAAIVVPSGFCTDTGTIHEKIRKFLIEEKLLAGVIHFPSNFFANTNTSVSVMFLDNSKPNDNVMFLDASKLGVAIKESNNTRIIIKEDELEKIFETFTRKDEIPEFSKMVGVDQIKEIDYMIKAGLYFTINKENLARNRKDIKKQKEILSQKNFGLASKFNDSLFRNFILDEVLPKDIAQDKEWIEYFTISDLLEEARGGEWGKETPNKNYTEKVRCIRGTDIPKIRLCNYEKIPFRYVKKDHISLKSLEPNDVVIEISGGSPKQSTGRICIITEETIQHLETPVLCTNFCRVLRFKDKNLSLYIYNYLTLLYDHGQMFNLENNTSGIKNLIFPAFTNNLQIPFPKDKSIIKEAYTNIYLKKSE